MPFDRVVAELSPEREAGRNPLFQIMFGVQNAQPLVSAGPAVQPLPVERGTAKFELEIYFEEDAAGLHGWVEYSTELFERSTMARLVEQYTRLLELAVAEPARPIHALPLLLPAEQRIIVEEWNATARDFPASIVDAFAAQVAERPDATALAWSHHRAARSAYGELDRQLQSSGARPARARGAKRASASECAAVGRGEVDRGAGRAQGVGAAYVPIDPAYPAERTRAGCSPTRAFRRCSTIWNLFWRESDAPLREEIDGDQLAYVMYTSGSTGRPKGVTVPHRAP